MARLVLSDIISDIRGTVGTHTYSYWKGIHLVKNRSVNFRSPWESNHQDEYRLFIAKVSQYWTSGLSQAQRDGWETYADYIATLGYPYYGPGVEKLVGWRQYGGIMSGFNAYVLTNMLRRSIGKTTILEDDPLAINPPPQPILYSAVFIPGPPKKLRVTVGQPETLTEDTWIRVFCRGHKLAHLIMAKVVQATLGGAVPWDVDYDCSVEPPVAAPPWTLEGTDECTSDGSTITIDTDTPGGVRRCDYFKENLAFDNTVGWIVEVRMKVFVAALADNRLMIKVGDGTKEETLMFAVDKIKLDKAGDEYVMDTTDDYHVYRLAGKGNILKVYVDGILRIYTTLSDPAIFKRVYFGDNSLAAGFNSKSQWDYIRYYDAGDSPPNIETHDWQNMRYAQGFELPLQNDLYDVQIDHISENGRYSPPSEIRYVGVYNCFPGGLWGSYVWNTYAWDG